MKTSLLMYDIPQGGGFPNPSGYLRSRALRINLSIWVVDQDRTPWNLLHEMSNAQPRVDWHMIEFSEGATEAILKLAHANIVRELVEAQQREAESLARIDRQLAEAEANLANGPRTMQAAEKRHARERASCLKRTEKLVKDLETACRMFGMDMTGLPFAQHWQRVASIRALNGARAEFYTQMAEAVRDTPMAAAAANNEVPADVLADYAEERGMETTAVRAAFADTTTAEARGATRVLSSSQGENGHTPLREAAPARHGTAERREYSAMTRNGIRRVWSSFTNHEAAQIIRNERGMGSELAQRVFRNRPISRRQLPWLHILAVELVGQDNDEPMPPAPMPPALTAEGLNDKMNTEYEEQKQPNYAADDTIPGEKAEDAKKYEWASDLFSWTKETKTFATEASTLQLRDTPNRIGIRSIKTGAVKPFKYLKEVVSGEGELISSHYESDDGIRLVIFND